MNNVEINKQAKLSEHLASPSEAALGHSSELDGSHLSPHFTLGELTKTKHVTGCAVDIRCAGKEQMIRYASILLDIADGTGKDYDELLLEQHGNVCWLHFAVRPPSQQNRRRSSFLRP